MTTLPAGYGYGKSSARLALVIHKLMSTTYTDIQLKQTLAKMLPDLVMCTECMPICGESTPGAELIDGSWRHHSGVWTLEYRKDFTEVLDTELLHLCWLAEETIWDTPKMED